MTYVAFIGGGGGPPPTPEWHEVQALQTSDVANNDRIGFTSTLVRNGYGSVCMGRAATICVVGVQHHASDEGAAYVLVRTGSEWSEAQKLTASDGAAGDLFGAAVAISGDETTIAIGAPGAAAVYVFGLSGETWVEQEKLEPVDGDPSGLYGASLALSENGNTMAVGAPTDFSDDGTVYINVRVSGSWSQQDALFDSEVGQHLGCSVALSETGDTVAAGAPGRGGGSLPGAVIVWVRSGTWSLEQIITRGGGFVASQLGSSVALSDDGNTLLAGNGSADDDYGGASFTRSAGAWSFEADITSEVTSRRIAVSCTGDGNTALVADFQAGDNGVCEFMTRSAGAWSLDELLGGSSSEADDQFGIGAWIAKDGGYAVVVAPGDNQGGTDRGLIYFFEYS